MRIHYLLFVLIITLFGYMVCINNDWITHHNDFAVDVARMLNDFNDRLSTKDDLMKRALESYGTQIHINKAWIKRTIAEIDGNKEKG